MLLYCVRHGETTFNAEGRIQGRLDTPLSPAGWKQCELIARAVAAIGREHPIDFVIASPLRRALDTARPIAEQLGVELRTDDRLAELNAGVFQGLLPSEMAVKFPDATERWRTHDPDFVIPGGESRRQLMTRGTAALDELLRSGGKSAVVVAHGGLLTAAFKGLLGIAAERSPFMLYNGSISTIEFTSQVRLLTLNQVEHLRGPNGELLTRFGDL
jgi:probable phosphoglycerate mutase